MQRNLNHYIETQIHSEILLSEHVVAIVADPSFQKPNVNIFNIQTKYKIQYNGMMDFGYMWTM